MATRYATHHSKSGPAPRCADTVEASPNDERRARTRSSLLSFYVRALGEFFRDRENQEGHETGQDLSARGVRLESVAKGLVFLVASALHAFGHAVLALAAGQCAVMLAGGSGAASGVRSALLLGSIGAAASIAKTTGGILAAYGQANISSRVGRRLRLDVLNGWFASYRLRRPRQIDHGQEATTPGLAQPFDGPIPLRTAAQGVSALTVRVREVETGLAQGLLGGGRALAQLVPLVGALVWIAPKLALVAVGVLAPFGWALASLRRGWKRSSLAAIRDGEELLEAADEAIRHADLWVTYSAQAKANAAVAELGLRLGQKEAHTLATSAAMSGGNEVLGALALVGALGAASAGWLGDVGGGGRLLAFTVCFFLAYRPIRELTEARLAWSRAALAFDGLRGPLSLAAAYTSKVQPDVSPAPPWPLLDLHLERVVLGQGSGAPMSFTVRAGEVVVVMGPTGAGKTTLLRTLLGLEALRSGRVRYGKVLLDQLPPGLHDRPFAWVPQDSGMLAATLHANVGIGADVPPEQVRATLRRLGAEHLVDATGQERLGPGGIAVSGGERQWIALARALTTGQPVLLLDEPTSGLDRASQATVLAAIDAVRGSRSVVVVTHRPEPLAIADWVVRLDATGVAVERGLRSPS